MASPLAELYRRTFQVAFTEDSSVVCIATRLASGERQPMTLVDTYTVAGKPEEHLLDWVRKNIDTALTGS